MTTTPPGGGGKPPVPPKPTVSLENLADIDAAANADASAPAPAPAPAVPITGAANSDESPQTGAAGAASAPNSDGEDNGNGQGRVSRRLQRRDAIKIPRVPARTAGANELADDTATAAGQAATPKPRSRSQSPNSPIPPNPTDGNLAANTGSDTRSRSSSPPPRPPKPQSVGATAGATRSPSPKPTAPPPPPISTMPRRPAASAPSSPAAQGNKPIFSQAQTDVAGVPHGSPYPPAERGPENLAAMDGLKTLFTMVQEGGAGSGGGSFLPLCLGTQGIFRLSADKKTCDTIVNTALGREAPSSPKTASKFKGLFSKAKKADAAETAGLLDITPLSTDPILWAAVVKQLTNAALTEGEKKWLYQHAIECQNAEGSELAGNYPLSIPLLPKFLQDLFTFCNRVVQNSDTNKMTSLNLAVCFAPNFLPSDLDAVQFVQANATMMKLIQLYIEGKTQI